MNKDRICLKCSKFQKGRKCSSCNGKVQSIRHIINQIKEYGKRK